MVWRRIMAKWFSCLIESIGISIVALAVIVAILTFVLEKCG